jgi:hypothetical protein
VESVVEREVSTLSDIHRDVGRPNAYKRVNRDALRRDKGVADVEQAVAARHAGPKRAVGLVPRQQRLESAAEERATGADVGANSDGARTTRDFGEVRGRET